MNVQPEYQEIRIRSDEEVEEIEKRILEIMIKEREEAAIDEGEMKHATQEEAVPRTAITDVNL